MQTTFKFRAIAPSITAVTGLAFIASMLLNSINPPALAQDQDIVAPVCVSAPNTSTPVTCSNNEIIRPDKEIFITNTCVVDDPCRTTWDKNCDPQIRGAWTFGKLMASLAGFQSIDDNPLALSDFVESWLKLFATQQQVNGFDVAPRLGIADLVDKWHMISEINGTEGLDMTLAPFRLLAIANRMDLRQAPGPYGGGNAGEGRFVFVILDINLGNPTEPSTWSTLPGTVIFEYQLPAETCENVLEWAKAWHGLGSFPSFDESYRQALQDVTDMFAGFNALPSGPNGSALNQLRTNEIAFDSPWELREFKLVDSGSNYPAPFVLGQVTVAQTVDITFSMDPFFGDPSGVSQLKLGQWVTDNEIDINHERHVIPLTLPDGTPFNAGSSLNPSTQFFWRVLPDFDFDCRDTRHNFSIANCNGCHSREADVNTFRHVNGRTTGNPATVSEFLSGVPAGGTTDPSCPQPPLPGAVTRQFNDILRRALDLCALLDSTCEGNFAELDGEQEIFKTGFEGVTVH